MNKPTPEMRLAHWTALIHDCRGSGMTARAWCLHNGIGEKQFYYWQRRVRAATCQEVKPSDSEPAARFAPLAIKTDPAVSDGPALTLHAGNYTLEINHSASETLLATVLKVISHV